MKLRSYQAEAIEQTYEYWRQGKGDNPLIVAPTGAGKSLILAQMIKDAMSYRGTRVLVLTHVKELLEQNAETLMRIAPEIRFGFYSAGLGRKETDKPVIFGGIQSIYKKAGDFIPFFDLIFVDEAHLIPENTRTRYGKFLEDARVCNPRLKIVGLTATPYRLDSGLLYEGEGALFDGVSYDIEVGYLMKEGYLSRLVSRNARKEIDLTGVGKRGGEFIEGDLARAASDPDLVRSAVSEIVEKGRERKSWLLFCSGVEHAKLVMTEVQSYGIDAELITGDTNKEERKQTIARFKRGELRCLISIGVLTTGFDAPNTDLVALIRATMSTGLYVQMAGRGTRTSEGKEDCLLLDFGGNVTRHGLFDAVNPTARSQGTGEAPAKTCPECQAHVNIAEKVCAECGYEFPEPERSLNHNARSYDGAVTSDQVEAKWMNVDNVEYRRWAKRNNTEGKPDTLRVTYHCGLVAVSEWLCPDHEGFARSKYEARMSSWGAFAETLDEALLECGAWNMPSRVKVIPGASGYLEIVQLDYAPPEDPARAPMAMLPAEAVSKLEERSNVDWRFDAEDIPF